MPRPAFGVDASGYTRQDHCCTWSGCREHAFSGLPVCFLHATVIADVVDAATPAMPPDPSVQQRRKLSDLKSWVYYLMIGPSTVKIGVTTNLPRRLNALRTDIQYVVAIELGGRALEAQRHKQFAVDRVGRRREDFRLSDELKHHIDRLQSKRDKMVASAIEHVRLRNTLT